MVKGSIQSQQVRIKLGVSEMALVEIPNSNLKQYYYNVIKELQNIVTGRMVSFLLNKKRLND